MDKEEKLNWKVYAGALLVGTIMTWAFDYAIFYGM